MSQHLALARFHDFHRSLIVFEESHVHLSIEDELQQRFRWQADCPYRLISGDDFGLGGRVRHACLSFRDRGERHEGVRASEC